MKTYTKIDIKIFKVIRDRIMYPTGDYSEIDTFEDGGIFDKYCKFGPDTSFGDGCRFKEGCEFGESCNFGRYCTFDSCCVFSSNCRFDKFCRVSDSCEIEGLDNGTLFGLFSSKYRY